MQEFAKHSHKTHRLAEHEFSLFLRQCYLLCWCKVYEQLKISYVFVFPMLVSHVELLRPSCNLSLVNNMKFN